MLLSQKSDERRFRVFNFVLHVNRALKKSWLPQVVLIAAEVRTVNLDKVVTTRERMPTHNKAIKYVPALRASTGQVPLQSTCRLWGRYD